MLDTKHLLILSLSSLLTAASLSAATTHKVQSGDTLSSIARNNGTTVAKLMSLNGIKDAKMLKVGQQLKLSSSTPSQPSSSAKKRTSTGGNSHSVKSGETLYSISRATGVSVSQLTALNPGLDPSKLKIGQQIRTGGAAASAAPKTPKAIAATPPKPAKKAVTKPAPAPAPKPVQKPAPQIAKKSVPAPAKPVAAVALTASTPAPVAKPEATKSPAPAPATISSVLVDKEISFGALASKHRTSTQQLNELNGFSLKPTTILAKGSEIYVPGL